MSPAPNRRALTPDVHVVTDSTASLPADLAERWGIRIVALQVVIDGTPFHEGVDLATEDLTAALDRRAILTTSQPSAHTFAEAYRQAAAAGARHIVSVHLSGELSGTVHAAALAARTSPVPVEVVDSRTVAMGLGFAALAAARTAAQGATSAEVARAAMTTATSSEAMFVVDSLDHLRRGGRLGAAAAAVGTALGLRPVLGVRGGRVEVVHKIRTRAAMSDRLVEAAVSAAARGDDVRLAMHYLGDDAAVRACAAQISEATGREVLITPVSAVLGAHVGPGLLALITSEDVTHSSVAG